MISDFGFRISDFPWPTKLTTKAPRAPRSYERGNIRYRYRKGKHRIEESIAIAIAIPIERLNEDAEKELRKNCV